MKKFLLKAANYDGEKREIYEKMKKKIIESCELRRRKGRNLRKVKNFIVFNKLRNIQIIIPK